MKSSVNGYSKYATLFMVILITFILNLRLKVSMVHLQFKYLLGTAVLQCIEGSLSTDLLINIISQVMRHDLSHNFPTLGSQYVNSYRLI
jgi:hypothetical protein